MSDNTIGPYVRITKCWDRNSGWAQMSWLYYVDLVNAKGEVSKANAHGYSMNKYGLGQGEATRLAQEHADFFGWPVRTFEEERITTTTLKEKT
jgi:hypothetical protein